MTSTVKESIGCIDQTGTLARPVSGSVVSHPNDAEWEKDSDTGFAYKSLFNDKASGQSTMLMKVEPGKVAPPHGHDDFEQVYVIEGDFYDEYRTYGPGDFIVRAPGAIHTGGTENGAIVLLFYSK